MSSERNVIVGLGQRVKLLPDPTIGLDTLTMEVAGGFEPAETAFGNTKEAQKYSAHLGCLGWSCDALDHMIHFTGDRFLGPRVYDKSVVGRRGDPCGRPRHWGSVGWRDGTSPSPTDRAVETP